MRMLRIIRCLALLPVVTLLVACGNLRVSVDVLDPAYVRHEMADEQLRKLYRDITTAQPGAMAARVDRTFAVFRTDVGQLTKNLRAAAAKLPRSGIEESAKALDDAVGPGGNFSNDASRQGTKLETLAQEIRATSARLGYDGRSPFPKELRDLLVSFQNEDKKLAVAQIKDVREVKRNVDNAAREAAARRATETTGGKAAEARAKEAALAEMTPQLNAVRQSVATAQESAARSSIVGDNSLAATDFAYVVAHAPDAFWEPEFNRAYANGTLGNVDIVIRLNSTADFSVKGMLFDASKVAQVASKVLTQSVLLGAQMAGVPVPAATTGTQSGADALSKSSADLAASNAVLAKQQALLSAQKGAIRSLARSIISASSSLSSDALKNQSDQDKGRLAVHDAVDASVSSLRNLLSMENTQ